LCGVPIVQFETLLSLQVGVLQATDPLNRLYRRLDQVASELTSLARFDVAFVDPYHSYRDSMEALELAESSLEDAGWMVVHDCFPPHDLTCEAYRDGLWCGHTFSAFRDFSARSGRAWFVLDADYGLGVLAPKNTSHHIVDPISAELETMWLESDQPSRCKLLEARGRELMRALPPDLADSILAKIIDREPIRLADLDYATGRPPFDPRGRPGPIDILKQTARKALAVGR
jgi:hypothetical protein